MDLTKFKEALGPIELTEAQEKALIGFFSEAKTEIESKYAVEDGDELISKKDAEAAFTTFQEDSEKAFNLFKEDAEKAFELLKTHSGKAFDLYSEDLKNEYAENMIKGLKDLYESLEKRAVQDFSESKDYLALEAIKKSIAPLMAAESSQLLVEEIDKLKQENEELTETGAELTRTNVISSLLKGLPENYVGTVKDFISEGKSDEDIYNRFATICEAIEAMEKKKEMSETPIAKSENPSKGKGAKGLNPTQKSHSKDAKVDVDKHSAGPTKQAKGHSKSNKAKKENSTLVMTSEDVNPSVKSKSKEAKKKEENKARKYFTEEEQALLEQINMI